MQLLLISCIYCYFEDSMENAFFTGEMIEAITNCDEWKLVSTIVMAELYPIHHSAHERWMSRHVDRHPHREVLFSLSGKGLYGFQGNTYPCNPGAVFLFDAYEAHDDSYPPHAPPGIHLWLSLHEEKAIARILTIVGEKYLARHSFVVGDAAAVILLNQAWTRMAQNREIPEPFRRMRMISAISSALMAAVEQGYGLAGRTASPGNHIDEILDSIMRNIAASGGNGLNLDNLARYSGYSKFHFLRTFKKHAGKSVHEYIDECRMKKADALAKRGLNKGEIAETLGFSSLSVYCRWLRNYRKKMDG